MFKGKLTRLRQFRSEDIPAIIALFNDEVIQSNTTLPMLPPATGETVRREFIEEVKADDFRYIIEDLTGQFLGYCHFRNSFKDRRTALAYEISPQVQGKGYAADSLELMLNLIFMEMNMNKCSVAVLSTNKSARQLLEAAGFLVEVVAREDIFRHGAYQDVLILGQLKSDYILNCTKKTVRPNTN